MNWADLTEIEPSNDITIQKSLPFNKLYNDKVSYSKIVKKELNSTFKNPVQKTESERQSDRLQSNNTVSTSPIRKSGTVSTSPIRKSGTVSTSPIRKSGTDSTIPKETKKKGRNNYCYTCKPRGKVQKHIIERSELKQVVFHFDLHKRPLILVTPIKHYNTIYEIPGPEIASLFEGIRIFCDEWNIKDYQVSFNNGEWQTHSHFHIKIKTSEKIVNRLRRDHFLRLKLQQNYSDSNISA